MAVLDSARKAARPGAAALAAIDDEPDAAINLLSARNEAETAQLLVDAAAPATLDVRIVAPRGPGGTLDGTAVFLVHHHAIDTPSDSHGATGLWPDALVPLAASVRVREGQPAVLWLRVPVGPEARPGRYTGAVELHVAGALSRSVPLHVEVFAARLPAFPTLPVVVGVDWESVRRIEGAGRDERALLETVAPSIYAALRAAGAFPFNLADPWPTRTASGWDFRKTDLRLRQANLDGPGTGPIPVPFSLGAPIDSRNHPPFSAEWRLEVVSYLRAIAAHLADRGEVDRSVIYVAETDEPGTAERVAQIAAFHALVAEADKRLRVVQTIHAHCSDCDPDMLESLESPVTLWVPNIAFLDGAAVGAAGGFRASLGLGGIERFDSGWTSAFEARIRASGRPVWWYLNAATGALPGPHPAYPSLHIDHDAMAHRVIGWHAWARNISAVGHWMATYWRGPRSPWQSVPRGEGNGGTNGDGVLLYPASGAAEATGQPAPAGPCPSIRLETLRETCEDHALLSVAETRLGRAAVLRHVEAVIGGGPSGRLDSVTSDPAPLRAARRTLLRELA